MPDGTHARSSRVSESGVTDSAYADALILFGISGDLARKKLFSALYGLTAAGHPDLPVVGVAASGWSDATLRIRAPK